MARKSKEELVDFFKTEDGVNKIDIVKNGLENKTIKTFSKIFAIIVKSNIRTILGTEFYAFDKKIADPGRFSLREIEALAAFLNVSYDLMYAFVRQNMVTSNPLVKKERTEKNKKSSSKKVPKQ